MTDEVTIRLDEANARERWVYEVVERLSRGMTKQAIVKELGMSTATLDRTEKLAIAKGLYRKPSTVSPTERHASEVSRLVAEGKIIAQVANILGITQWLAGNAYRFARTHGMTGNASAKCELVTRARQLMDSGLTLQAAASRLIVHPKAIYRSARRVDGKPAQWNVRRKVAHIELEPVEGHAEAVAVMRNQGLSYMEIAQQRGISEYTARRAYNFAVLRMGHRKRQALYREHAEATVGLYDEGKSLNEAAAILGVDRNVTYLGFRLLRPDAPLPRGRSRPYRLEEKARFGYMRYGPRLAELVKTGLSLRQAAKQLDLPADKATRFLHNYRVSVRKEAPSPR